ncbi:MAG: transporter protein ATP-binding protein [Acidimicrobiaceae bacterium]|nr:transporter protein ATP-binding protein [Acidimicrobiaceae bacterium]
MSDRTPLLRVRNLTVNFGSHRKQLSAVAGVSFDIFEGETLGLVGESGCGKSTTGKALMRIVEPTSGSIELEGTELTTTHGKALRNLRTRMQMIFQDPISSLNPRRRARDLVAEPLDCWKSVRGAERDALVNDLLNKVGIDPEIYGDRYARQFSGGQCQRISIARSLAMRPKLLICDEMVSALDVSVQAQILNLLVDLKREYGLALLFIAHDLAVVKYVSDRVAVMYLGKICEIGPADTLYDFPEHPYTEFLLGAALEADPDAPLRGDVLAGEPPSPTSPPSGCRFRTRCPFATDKCATEEPPLEEIVPGHRVACHYPLSLSAEANA